DGRGHDAEPDRRHQRAHHRLLSAARGSRSSAITAPLMVQSPAERCDLRRRHRADQHRAALHVFAASNAPVELCHWLNAMGPPAGAYGCIPSKYLAMADAPIAPLTAFSHGACRVTSVPTTGMSPCSCCSSDKKVAPVWGSTSVKITCGCAASMFSISAR